MTRDEAQQAVKVLQHYADGGDVQYRLEREEEWKDGTPLFNFAGCKYRIKPKPAEGWGTIYGDNPDTLCGWASEGCAREDASRHSSRRVIHWREIEQ